MGNAVLDRKREERANQLAFVDELLAKVDADGTRDLVEAEQKNLQAAQERVRALDAQIGPLEEFEAMRAAHQESAASFTPTSPRQDRQAVGGGPDRIAWASAGAFLVDHLRANGYMTDAQGRRVAADPDAMARVRYALQNQTTTDTPGLLPHPIVGSVVNLIDASRPFITSIGGGRPMGGIPGKTFGRPKVTQHTLVGLQAAEKTELPSRKMIIGEVPFTKLTKGGAVDVSRQDIDWSSPAAWDILVRDLADVYAQETEAEAAAAFALGADDTNAATVVASADLTGWATALYDAAALVYASAHRLPDRIWCSVDVWANIGPIVDTARLVFGPGSTGQSSLSTFGGNMFELPRIVVPSFPAATCIIGAANAFEVYEEAIGLLTAVEPSLLGVEVAYGGYIAFNYVATEAVAPLTAPAGPLSASRSGSSRSESKS